MTDAKTAKPTMAVNLEFTHSSSAEAARIKKRGEARRQMIRDQNTRSKMK